MNATNHKTPPIKAISEIAELYRCRLKFLEDVVSLVRSDPDFASEIASLLQSSGNGAAGGNEPTRRSTQFGAIEAYFGGHDNSWANIADIAAGVGISVNAVRQVLYKSRKDSFSKRKCKSNKKLREYRLKESPAA